MEKALLCYGMLCCVMSVESVQDTLKQVDYQGTLERNILYSVSELCLSPSSWLLHQDNYPKYTVYLKEPGMDVIKTVVHSDDLL